MLPSPFARLFGIKSASFANGQYRNQGDKATKKRNSYQKIIICAPSSGGPYLCLLRRNSCAAGAFSLVTAVRFLNGQEAFFIDYSGAKYARFPPKIAAALKALFRVVENGGFINRLRNGHLEKSAVTGI